MVAVEVVLHHFHRLKLFEESFLCDFILAFVGIMFEVSDIGDVSDVAYFIAQMGKVSEKDVESYCRTSMPEMTVSVNRWAADIHSNVGCMKRLEGFFGAAEGVVDGQVIAFHRFGL